MAQKDKQKSYIAANVLPAKVIQTQATFANGRLYPVHIQLNPTNRCNRKCDFCSCSARDKKLELPLPEIEEIFSTFASMGTRAVTITGGGEPLMHLHINEIIESAKICGIKVGLVTNGDLLNRLNHGWPTWVRISCSDTEVLTDEYLFKIDKAIAISPEIDWAWSYVLTRNPNLQNIKQAINFADTHNFSHMRIVSDLLDVSAVPHMDEIKEQLGAIGQSKRVIYQGRRQYTKGRTRCLISLIKPNIAADGMMFPCCGAQYALAQPTLDYCGAMSMGHWREFAMKIGKQESFNGIICAKCYYDNYNEVLELCTANLDHEDFI